MEKLLQKFYNAFVNQDAETMASCYHEDIVFKDPAFGKLYGKDAGDMWRMLCENGKGVEITFSEPIADQEKGLVKWEAKYTFSQTGRPVHNIVLAKFKFKDGKIIEHIDTFNLYEWSKQAMGLKGLILGKTSFFKTKLKQTTNSTLRKFQETL
ncbi:nuclear transport factor 2 family protein [Arcticibacterium luteifluviistationis]|uniref:Nuclear transport factor 2 family protein n=1 Tax=Arcticibacterium luteifluviistationis TaxID=1784714 RepID=A0A2Z4G8M9_9BACT|nr:nuclear transport factor 2 family protein [Arcticibacterium luteifluviistationis]AWV97589.1 nuclear transport factor 2 family protein [Arcticibacterium luteifluviistationis]